jgi:flagellar motor switch protein FliG
MTSENARLSGAQKVAAVMLSIDEASVVKLFELMNEDEIRDISLAMASLGHIKKDMLERLLLEFANELGSSASFTGDMDTTERLLEKVLGRDRLGAIMDEIRGPAGKNTWDKLGM